jgi:hypothetical protein
MIMIGNVYGNAFDALRHRLKGQPVDGSRLRDEIGVLTGAVILVPWIMARNGVRRLLRKETA